VCKYHPPSWGASAQNNATIMGLLMGGAYAINHPQLQGGLLHKTAPQLQGAYGVASAQICAIIMGS